MVDEQHELALNLVASKKEEKKVKYAYFLFAANASGLALIFEKTQDLPFSYDLIPIGGAFCCWAYGLFLSMRYLHYEEKQRFVCQKLRDLIKLFRTELAITQKEYEKRWHLLMDEDGVNCNITNLSNLQVFRFLTAGGICYALWHILKMFEITYPGLLNLFHPI